MLSGTSLILEGLKPGDPIIGEPEEVRKAGERAGARGSFSRSVNSSWSRARSI
jgi:hypothetical protein